ncbi:MAG: ABC transporter ATP-binding protein [Armatimonadota bacterium]|nr:ABC transporter ATP-binding protein [Armatimonadota bacterium]MDR7450229.1 ABC transporter ATP-binding protein [Armatimonadota bacterium]MDR7460400.1 ABC transporter ATP-binding protein [Armatimonadota bacterium]MDR7479097.1 ABC transporter ATP-binding protein [Armatimonadota bacterium]MDR7488986.1 ABC transporter ATP-binding protein [Armatimonadota bacterium]
MLTVEGLTCAYGQARVVHQVSFHVAPGEVLALLGRNGAGKTTTLRAVMGLLRPVAGRIRLDGVELTGLPAHAVPRLGLGYVPQGRRLFPALTVEENLRMGLLVRGGRPADLEPVFALFPVLRQRLRQRAATLSGGEQQMVATARALAARPRVLLLDEPTEGLAPLLAARLLETLAALRAQGVGVLLVEQRIEAALRVADRVAVLETGRLAWEGSPGALRADEGLLLRLLGVRRAPGRPGAPRSAS